MQANRDVFFHPKARLKRANQHLNRFKNLTQRFLENTPRKMVSERETDGLANIIKICFEKSLPGSCEIAATEAIQAFRDTLDYVGAATAALNGFPKSRSCKFPFGATADDVKDDIARGCHDIPPEIRAHFEGFKPYKTGNVALWTLNQLRNPTTHHSLVPMATFVGGMQVDSMMMSRGSEIFFSTWDSEKNEIILARVGRDSQLYYNAKISLFVTFNDATPAQGAPAVEVLQDISIEVSRVIRETEAKCRSIGLLK